MSIYILRRLILLVLTWFVITLISYAILTLSPNYTASFNGWINYLSHIFTGSFGVDIHGYNIAEQLFYYFPASLELLLLSFLVSFILGITLGTIGGLNLDHRINSIIRFFMLIGRSVPAFAFAAIFVIYASPASSLLPSSGRYDLLFNVKESTHFYLFNIFSVENKENILYLKNIFFHILLPVLSLSLLPTTEITSDIQSSVMEIMKTNYIKAAISKGMSHYEMIFRHVLPNAMPLIISHFGNLFSTIFSLIIVIEAIFDWPGIGRWLLMATIQENYVAISAAFLVITSLILFVNVLSEVIGNSLNPLIRKRWDAIV